MKLAVSSFEFKNGPVGEMIQQVTALGVKYVELWPHTLQQESLAAVLAQFQSAGLQVSCVSAQSRYRINTEDVALAQEAIFQAIELAAFFGAKYVTTYQGPNPRRSFYTTLRLYQQNLTPCLEEASRHGVKILLENMFDYRNEDPDGMMLARSPEALRLICERMASTPFGNAFGITFDPANFYMAGEEPYPLAYDLLADYIEIVHIKDAKRYVEWLHGERSQHAIWEDSRHGPFISVPPGEGSVNWYAIFQRLQQDGFDGFLTLDLLTNPNTLSAFYERAIQYSKRFLSP